MGEIFGPARKRASDIIKKPISFIFLLIRIMLLLKIHIIYRVSKKTL